MLLSLSLFSTNKLLRIPEKKAFRRLAIIATSLVAHSQVMASENSPVNNASTEQQNDRKALVKLFQSRLPQADGKPDVSAYSQCVSADGMSRAQLVSATADGDKIKSNRVQMLADSVPVNNEQQTHLQGNVSVRDYRSLMRAAEIYIDRQTQKLTASGGVSFESQDAFFSAETLTRETGENNSNQVELAKTQFYLFTNHANGQAEQITLSQDEIIRLKDLTFSTCPIGEPTWQFATAEMEVDPEEGRGEAWNTVLRVGGVPVFYLPYINFPVDDRRKSGLLSPTLKNSDNNGLDIALPIYWNIAPEMDATFTPRYIEKRGEQLGSEFRLLTEKTFNEFNFEWLNKDKLVQAQLDNPQAGVSIDANNSRRWFGAFKNTSQFNENWRTNINARKVSDSDYFRDFGSGLESSNETRLSSELELTYEDEIWQMRWFALSHQSLIGTDSYRYLPSWTTAADYTSNSGWRWQLSSDATRFAHKDIQQTEGDRLNILPSVSYPVRSSWGFMVPKLGYQFSRYEQRSQLTDDTTSLSRNLPIFSLDSGIYLDRQVDFGGKQYTHSLIPRVFYTYIPFEEQSSINNFDTGIADFNFSQFWRENRFSGVDRVGDANQFNVALGNSLVSQESGSEVFSFQIGRIFYLDDREVQLQNADIESTNESPWLAEARFHLNTSLSISSIIEWDERNNHTNRAETRLNFEPKDNHIVNLSHRYRDNAGQLNEEIDFSFAWSINERWRMVGRWYNDLSEGRTIEAMAGIEYESCCWAVRLVGQKYLNTQLDSFGMPISINDEYNEGIYLQFVLKGLGSAGQSGLDRLLTSSIAGYRDPFARENSTQR